MRAAQQIVDLELEPVAAKPGDDFEMLADPRLVLEIDSDRFGAGPDRTIAGPGAVSDRGNVDPVRKHDQGPPLAAAGRDARIEETVDALIAGRLIGEIDPDEKAMLDRPGGEVCDQIILDEQVSAMGRVAVGLDRDSSDAVISDGHRTGGKGVLVGLVIVAVDRLAGQLEAIIEAVLKLEIEHSSGKGAQIIIRRAEKSPVITLERPRRIEDRPGPRRGNAAVDDPPVSGIFEAEVDPRVGPGLPRQRGINADAVACIFIAKIVEFLIDRIESAIDVSGDGRVDIGLTIPGSFAVERSGGTRKAGPLGPLGHPIDHPASAAASENHCVGTLEHLDPLEII